MWFRKQRTKIESMTSQGGAGKRRRSPKFGPRTVEALEDRSLMSHVVHPAMAHEVHALARHQTRFVQTNLVSDGAVPAAFTDPKLVNPWGLVAGPTTPWWVNDNGTGFSTLYSGTGTKVPRDFTVPPAGGSPAGTTATPTGIVFNGDASEFLLNGAGTHAIFIFATEDGTISGWNPNVPPTTPPGGSTTAVLKVDNSTGAVYKGLALANTGVNAFAPNPRLFATNFHAGTVDVFDSTFQQVTLASGAFTDPKLPKGFAPFGIQAFTVPGTSQSVLFVTYAKQDADKEDDVAGKGNGFVDVFDASGKLLQRVASRGTLNSPWGIAVAPSNFGKFSGDLLVGNFGDGRINAFKLPHGRVAPFRLRRPAPGRQGQTDQDQRSVGPGVRQRRCSRTDEHLVLHGGH